MSSRRHRPVASLHELTDRQRDVAAMIAAGATNAEIAARLDCSSKTVDSHRHDALVRLGLRNNADLTRAAIRDGMVSMHDGASAYDVRKVKP